VCLVSTTAKDLAFFCFYFFLKRSIPVMFGFSVDSVPKDKGYGTPDDRIILSIARTTRISATKLVPPPRFYIQNRHSPHKIAHKKLVKSFIVSRPVYILSFICDKLC